MYKDQMRSYTVIAFFISFIISLALGYALLATRTSDIVPGATAIELVGRCQLIFFDTRLQPMNTLVLACPRHDMIRLWPLPVQQPWFENWWEDKPSDDFDIQLRILLEILLYESTSNQDLMIISNK
jgi:hypothetical protein